MNVSVKSGKQEALFSTPLFIFEIDGHEPLNTLLLEESRSLRDQSPGLSRSNKNGWHSKTDLFSRTEPGISKMCDVIKSCLFTVMKHSGKESVSALDFNGWININPKGAFNRPHNHPGYLWSGTCRTTRAATLNFLILAQM